MLLGNSDTFPALKIYTNEMVQLRYNIREVKKEDRTSFDYDFIEVPLVYDRNLLIKKIIENKYSKDDEIALLNNNYLNPGNEEYLEYQTYRAFAKTIATEIMER